MKYDLVIHGGLIATDYAVFGGTILVRDGKVAGFLEAKEPLPPSESTIDASGRVVMPGCIDAHVHLWEPGLTHRDDWARGTEAAAAGGITTILEHPLSVPPVKDEETFNLKLSVARAKAIVDFGLWGALIPESLNHVEVLNRLGCVGFKGFISYCNADYPQITDSLLLAAMERLKAFDGIVAMHCENADMTEYGGQRMKAMGRKDPLSHLESREFIAELEAIERVILFSKWTGAKLHIVHMSTMQGADSVRRAKSDGVKVTAETCPHFLALDCSYLEKLGPYAKCTPPLRRPENTDRLWQRVFDGTVDFIATDHVGFTREEKDLGLNDIWGAEPGLQGLQTMVPVMISQGLNERKLPLMQLVRLLSTNAARTFRLYPKKGTIIPGSDADFTIVDPDREWVVRGDETFYKNKWTPFEGMKLRGSVDITIVRGCLVFKDGAIVVKEGHGQFQRPQANQDVTRRVKGAKQLC